MEEGLKVILSADVSQFQEAFARAASSAKTGVVQITQILSSTGRSAENAALSFEKFVGQRMGAALKQFGTQGAAIRAVAAEWAVYSQAVGAAGQSGRGIEQTAGAVAKVAQSMGLLSAVSLPSTAGLTTGLLSAEAALKKFAAGEAFVEDLDRAIQSLVASTFAMGNTQGIGQLITSLQLLQAQSQKLNATGINIQPHVDVADTLRDIEAIKGLIGREQFRFTLSADPTPLAGAMQKAAASAQATVQAINQDLARVNFTPPSTTTLIQGLERAENAIKQFTAGTVGVDAVSEAIERLQVSKAGLSDTTSIDRLIVKLQELSTAGSSIKAVGLTINPNVDVAGTLKDIERIKGLVAGQKFHFELTADSKGLQNSMVLSAESTRTAVQDINRSLSLAGEGFEGFTLNAQRSAADYVKAISQLSNVPTAVKTTVQAPDMTPVIQAVQKVKSEIAAATATAAPRMTLSADTTPFTNAIKAAQGQTAASAQAIVNDFTRIAAAAKSVGGNVNFGVLSFTPMVQAAQQAKANIDRVFLQPLPAIRVPQIPSTGADKIKKEFASATPVGQQFNQLLREMPNFAIDARIGVMSLSNNLPYFVDAIQSARRSGQGFGAIMKTMAGSIFSVSGVAILAVTAFTAFAGSMSKSKKEVQGFGDELRDATRGAISEVATIQALVRVARDENNTRTQRLNAINELQKKYPEYLRNLSLENVNSLATAKAIDELTKSLVQKAVAQAYADKIAEATLKRDDAREKLQAKQNEQLRRYMGFLQEKQEMEKRGGMPQRAIENEALAQERMNREIGNLAKELQTADAEVDKYTKSLQDTTAAALALTRTPQIKSPKVDTKNAEDALDKLAAYVKNMNLEAQMDFEAVPVIKAPTDFARQYFDSLKQQFDKEVVVPLSLTFTPEQIKANALTSAVDDVFTSMMEKYRDAKIKFPTIDLEKYIKEGGAEKLKAYLQTGLDSATEFRDSMKKIMGDAAVDSITGFMEGVGEALTGGNLGKAFENVLGVLGSALQEMGKKLIMTSAIVESFKKALNGLLGPGGTQFGFAIGAAMVAIGSAMKSVQMPKFADGGIVFGPTVGLMGEYAGASSNPEVIAPLSKLKDMLRGAGGATAVNVNGSWEVSGDKLRLVLARSNRKSGRYN